LFNKFEKIAKNTLARFLSLFLRTVPMSPARLEFETIERLLVIRQQNQMGDMLCAVPAFRGLRNRFPGARISLVSAAINSEVMRGNPWIDEVLVYDKRKQMRNPFHLPRFIAELRRRRFDAALVLSTVSFSVTSMMLSAASGARIRIGCAGAAFGAGLTSRYYHLELPLPSPAKLERMHEASHNLYPLAAIGVGESDLSSYMATTPEDERACDRMAEAIDPGGKGFIVVLPGAGKEQNLWPAERFAEAAARLSRRFGCPVVAVRGPVDGPAFDRFLAGSGGLPPAAVISRPEIGFLAAVMRRASVNLCNDTGVMHIGGAVGARCVAVFGPTDPARWKPVNETVTAVRSHDGKTSSVKVDEVVEAAASLIAGSEWP